jgi:RNA methyltransferase, TrmH family
MLTKNQAKLIRSLRDKKNRDETGLFLVEGRNSTAELLESDFEITFLFVTEEFLARYGNAIKNKVKQFEVGNKEQLAKLGALETNNAAIAVVKQKVLPEIHLEKEEIIIALDTTQNPSNLGSIVRIADWYGVRKIFASKNTVDFYNPKTIFTSKGSFLRVNVFYVDLETILSKKDLPVFGAFMQGDNVHTMQFPKSGILLMGNEVNGISKDLEKFITKKITIPSYGSAESLNVAMATAVILDNWRKNL